MKIVISPDSYKESLSAIQVANCIEEGFKYIYPDSEYVKLPIADGGEGSLEAIKESTVGEFISVKVADAYLQEIDSYFYYSQASQTAFIEIAKICGLEQTKEEHRNPAIASTFGVGQTILKAIEHGAQKIEIFIGGSATNDAGTGMAKALGVQFLDQDNQEIPVGCLALEKLAKIDVSNLNPKLKDISIEVACDVENKLLGNNGATYIFGPQKGVKSDQREQFEHCLNHLNNVVKEQLDRDMNNVVGGGAAGGLGAGLATFCHATLRNGFELISDAVELEKHIQDADLVISGEGRIDSQSVNGKVVHGIAQIAKKYHKPVIAIGGCLSDDVEVIYDSGVNAVFSILNKISTLEEAFAQTEKNLILESRNIAATLDIFKLNDSPKQLYLD
ncbi:MAG: glycerate kinase [Vibrio sp.]